MKIRYDDDEGFRGINEIETLEPYSYMNVSTSDDENCLGFSITPTVTLVLGIEFLGFVDIYLLLPFSAETYISWPGTCTEIPSCDYINNPKF